MPYELSRPQLINICQFDELMQERRNSTANTLELRLSCTTHRVYMSMVLCKGDTKPLLMHWSYAPFALTHWGRVKHICVNKLTIIGSDNGLSPGRRQAIIWTNAGILLIRTLGTNFSEMLGKIHSFSFKKMHLKMSSAKRRLFRLGLNELSHGYVD